MKSKRKKKQELFIPNPFDGFRPVAHEAGGEIVLAIELTGGGEAVAVYPVIRVACDNKGRSKVAQLTPLVHAMCMYLATGGDMAGLEELVRAVEPMCEKFSVEVPKGYYLANIDYRFDVPKQYLFVSEDPEQTTATVVVPEESTVLIRSSDPVARATRLFTDRLRTES